MNTRIAKKIIKKHGTSWIVMNCEIISGKWVHTSDGFLIPSRWDNKTIHKWMNIRFPIYNSFLL